MHEFSWPSSLAAVLLAALGGCTALVPPPAHGDEDREDARVREARFVLLGEVHDNAVQHEQRAALLRSLMADGRPTTVVFEQMDRGRDDALASAPRDSEALASAGGLDRKAWRWPLHRPLLDAAAAGGASVRGGNLPSPEVRAIVRGGLEAVPADLRSSLDAVAWPPAAEAALERDIDAGHCHALPPAMWAPMALAQRARDASMAEAMLQSRDPRVVLIAGNGHVRRDRGVAFYLRQSGIDEREIVSVGYLEQQEGEEEEEDEASIFDIVHRTPAAERSDPCAAFETR